MPFVNVHFIPVPQTSYYAKMGYDMSDYPVTVDNFTREISLPVFYDLTNEMRTRVLKAVVESVEKVRND